MDIFGIKKVLNRLEMGSNSTLFGITALLVLTHITAPKPLEPFVVMIQVLFELMILPVVAIYIALNMQRLSTHDLVYAPLKALQLITCVLLVIDLSGDDLYAQAMADPQSVLALAIATIVAAFVLTWLPRPSGKALQISGTPMASTLFSQMTAHDTRHVAVHEAGHALLYAALGSIPSNIKVSVGAFEDSLGRINTIRSQHQLNTPAYVEWLLLTYLAGREAERSLCGVATLGSANDLSHWFDVASAYLENQCGELYFTSAKTPEEERHNTLTLTRLMTQQTQQLHQFFALNAKVLADLAATLEHKKCLDHDGLVQVLAQVQLPAEFPRPLGDFEVFGREWSADCGLFAVDIHHTSVNPNTN